VDSTIAGNAKQDTGRPVPTEGRDKKLNDNESIF
jgi:hypothetical protein